MARQGVFAEPDFRRFLLADLVSMLGSGTVPVALSFALAARGGGAGAIGAVLFAETAPLALLLLAGGIVADRWSPRPVMVGADLLRFVVQALLAALLWSGHAPLSVVIALSALIGIGTAFSMPGRSALLVRIVHPDRLQGANAALTMASSISTVLGPAAGGGLVAAIGPDAAVALDSLSYLLSAILLLRLRLSIAPGAKPATTGLAGAFADGWREYTSRRWIWLLAAQASLVFLLSWGPLIVLGALGYSRIAHGSVLWGGLLSALGAGVGAGAMLAGWLRPRRPILACELGFAVYPLLPASLALHWPYPVQAATAFAAGTGFGLYNVLWETTLQRTIPPALLSRVSSFDQFGSLCMLPLGYAIAAPLSAVLGAGQALLGGALATALFVCGSASLSDIRNAGRDTAV